MTAEAKRWRLIALVAIGVLVVLLILRLAGALRQDMAEGPEAEIVLPPLAFETVTYTELPGWDQDDHAAALPPMALSCAGIEQRDPAAAFNRVEALGLEEPFSLGGLVEDWLDICAKAGEMPAGAARQFFETSFTPVRIRQPGEDETGQKAMVAEGRFTGYFEPAYPASVSKTKKFTMPVLARPDNLVMVDLGAFRKDLAGKRIAGQVRNGRLIPYADHEDIAENGLDTDILAWMDPNDLLFLQIQGSGRLLLDGAELRIGYAAQNGHEYTAIGGPLIRSGEIAREDMSMQAIYDWLEAAPAEKAAALRYSNASYVFFRKLDDLPDPALGPLGAQGIQLTDGRSLAVDRRYYAMGLPVWVDLPATDEGDGLFRRLMIAQDTGGAIKGPVRGDIYVGSGREAGNIAGRLNRIGQLYVLLPNSVARRLEEARAPAPS